MAAFGAPLIGSVSIGPEKYDNISISNTPISKAREFEFFVSGTTDASLQDIMEELLKNITVNTMTLPEFQYVVYES